MANAFPLPAPLGWTLPEQRFQSCRCGRHLPFTPHFAGFLQDAIAAGVVPEVQPDGQPRFACHVTDRALRFFQCLLVLFRSAMLLHSRSPFCTSSAFSMGSLTHPAGDRPSHTISVTCAESTQPFSNRDRKGFRSRTRRILKTFEHPCPRPEARLACWRGLDCPTKCGSLSFPS